MDPDVRNPPTCHQTGRFGGVWTVLLVHYQLSHVSPQSMCSCWPTLTRVWTFGDVHFLLPALELLVCSDSPPLLRPLIQSPRRAMTPPGSAAEACAGDATPVRVRAATPPNAEWLRSAQRRAAAARGEPVAAPRGPGRRGHIGT